IVPSTIPPELYNYIKIIIRDKHTENDSFTGEWSPSLRATLARRIGFASQILYLLIATQF
ncbi:MAG: hypothetical protein J6D06_10830, partial [Clostridia bacterium]|nr:hypothetical protein [Clostridia bacterium]